MGCKVRSICIKRDRNSKRDIKEDQMMTLTNHLKILVWDRMMMLKSCMEGCVRLHSSNIMTRLLLIFIFRAALLMIKEFLILLLIESLSPCTSVINYHRVLVSSKKGTMSRKTLTVRAEWKTFSTMWSLDLTSMIKIRQNSASSQLISLLLKLYLCSVKFLLSSSYHKALIKITLTWSYLMEVKYQT